MVGPALPATIRRTSGLTATHASVSPGTSRSTVRSSLIGAPAARPDGGRATVQARYQNGLRANEYDMLAPTVNWFSDPSRRVIGLSPASRTSRLYPANTV